MSEYLALIEDSKRIARVERLLVKWQRDVDESRAMDDAEVQAWLAAIDDLTAALAGVEPCIGNDPTCPCRDGDQCHYRAYGDSPAMPIPKKEQP